MQTERIQIAGMTCGGCTRSVTNALKAVGGVSEVDVSLATGQATVLYNEQLTSPEQLKMAIKGAGYESDVVASASSAQPKSGCCGCGS